MGRVLVCLMAATAAFSAQAGGASIQWHRSPGNILSQESEWYASNDAIRIAENVLLYQRSAGGWPANRDMVRRLSEEEKKKVRAARDREDCTLDNGATHTHLRYLAAVYSATGQDRFKAAFLKGLDYLLEAQYANGGWPQTYPWRRGYHNYITFNDGAMIGAMIVLHDIAQQKPLYGFVDDDRRQKARKAVRKGIECILKCQIIVNGTRTAWCQQHDEKTFEPRPARRFEPAAITGCESVGVVQFLMSLANPSPEIIEAIQGAITWFDRVKITGIRQINKPDESGESGFDNVIVKDETAPPMWARLYEIGTNRPIFGDHDGKVHYAMSEISRERRTGYAWYGYWPAELLRQEYPVWQKKWAPGKSVLP
jgi:PelA/Pel-15E family pectate lyase